MHGSMWQLRGRLWVASWRFVVFLLGAVGMSRESVAAGLSSTYPGSGSGYPDDVYLQEVGSSYPLPMGLHTVAIWDGKVWVGDDRGVKRLENEGWVVELETSEPVRHLREAGGRLWAVGDGALWMYRKTEWIKVPGEGRRDVVAFRGEAMGVVGGEDLVRLGDGFDFSKPWIEGKSPFTIEHAASHLGSMALVGSGRVTYVNRGKFGGMDTYGFPSDQSIDWGQMISRRVSDVVSFEGALWLATDRGLGRLRGMTMDYFTGAEGLPVEATTSLAAGFAKDLWIGTRRGLVRYAECKWSYYAGQRWLPGDEVRGVAAMGDRVYVATDRGLGVIRMVPYTLAKKAEYYEKYMEAWGLKRLGFTHKLEWDEKTGAWVREVSDNDGGYSGDYLAAQSYRWAVTKDPVARREATNTFHALRWLEVMTGIPGFPARAVWAKGEPGHKSAQGSGGYPAEWHDTADGKFEWKGDTSSDEICSHFYAVGLFLELAAEGEEVGQAKRHLSRLARHLIEHEWKLVDKDGKPTRWGRWDPEYLGTDEGRFDRGLQALEILSFMKAAWHFTGEKQFEEAYERLVKMGYPEYTLRQRSTFPPEDMAHFEDQLAFWCWWNLLRFEKDPDLRAFYQRGYERSFEAVRVEQNPWYLFLYGTLTGHPCEPEVAVGHLREWPLDLRVWSFQNSHRADVRTPPGYRTYKGGIRAFSPREREPMRWDAWAMNLDGGNGGRDVMEAGSWLLAYWMGRYHGHIGAPKAEDSKRVGQGWDEVPKGGAKPYQGPPRPGVP